MLKVENTKRNRKEKFMELQKINNTDITIKEYNGQRVVTFKDIDAVHGRPDGTSRKRFNDNRDRFVEGEDYFKICASEFRTHWDDLPAKATEDVTLITESGYLMLVKSFTDDLAWKVQRELIKGYFRVKEAAQLSPAEQLLAQAQFLVEQERRLKALEASSAETSQKMDTVRDALDTMVASSITAENWQSQLNRSVRAFCMQTGFDFHKTFQQLYKETEMTAGVKLDVRVKFAKQRLQANGATQAEITAVSKLSIIAKDKKLREIFGNLFNRMVARYKLSGEI